MISLFKAKKYQIKLKQIKLNKFILVSDRKSQNQIGQICLFSIFERLIYQKMSIKGLKVSQSEIKYIFPRDIRSIYKFKSALKIKEKLKLEFAHLGLVLPNFPYFIQANKKYIFACLYCPNTIEYCMVCSPEGEFYRMSSFCIEHVHGISSDNQEVWKESTIARYYQFRNSERVIEMCLNQYEESVEEHLRKKSNSKRNRDKNISEETPKTFQELLSFLKSKNAYLYHEPHDLDANSQSFPDYLFICTPNMRETYHKHARSIGFDFTFSVIKETPLNLTDGEFKKEYLVGMIVGLNKFRKIAIFALVIATTQSTHYVKTTFAKFLHYVGLHPTSIVTDQGPGMLGGMRQLKRDGIYEGETFWDTFHVLNNYKCKNYELKKYLQRMAKQKCKYQFHRMYLEAVTLTRTEEELDVLHKYMNESNKYSISQIPAVFVGLGVSDSQNEMANNLVKTLIPLESGYLNVVYRVVQFIEERNNLTQIINRECCPVEEVIDIDYLPLLRYSLSRQVYKFVFNQFSQIHNIEIAYEDAEGDMFVIQDTCNLYYVLKKSINICNKKDAGMSKNNLRHFAHFNRLSDEGSSDEEMEQFEKDRKKLVYFCSCEFQEKTGIPCQHIFKVLLLKQCNILEHFDQYWLVKNPEYLQRCIPIWNEEDQGVVHRRGRPIGKATLYYLPDDPHHFRFPKGVRTYKPIKEKNIARNFSLEKPRRVNKTLRFAKSTQMNSQQNDEESSQDLNEKMRDFFGRKR